MSNAEAYQENYRKSVALVLDGSMACSWLEKEMAREIERMRAALKSVDDLYSHAWDRADGGLSMFGSSVPKFEAAHKAVREALGIKLLEADAE